MATTGTFRGEKAPCGRIVDGNTYRDDDAEAVVTHATDYACGCRAVNHEYHDGSVSRTIVRHDGHVILDELLHKE